MITSIGLKFIKIVQLSKFHIVWVLDGFLTVAALYYYNFLKFSIPWIPVSVFGTAVALFVGFKNNQAYNRICETRKIWGGIVNNSRT